MTSEFDDPAFGSPAPLAREVSFEIERAVLQLVVDGFERWKIGGFKRVGDHEDHFTVRLVACMKEIRRERNISLMPLYQYVEPSDEMLEGHKDPGNAPRIDMVVSWGLLTDDTYFTIECKRLAPGNLARLYVVDGIDRFVRGYYGAKAQAGAMIGYVIRGTPSAALKRINAHVERSPAMGPNHTLMSTGAIRSISTVFESHHPRPLPFQTIRLTHLFFDISGIGPAS